MEQFFSSIDIPENYIQLFLVVLFSLVIGLSQRKLQMKSENDAFFGSDRTFTLIGILGYILYIIDPSTKVFWGCGGVGLLLLLAVNYYFKLYHLRRYGITSIIIACITYCIPALIITQPVEFSLLVLVIVLLLTEMRETFISVASRMNSDEFITLAKFIIIAGIVLPLLPDNQPMFPGFIDLSARDIWLTTVVISGMSYASYLLQKFVFRKSSLLFTGILGGLYSSTATTVVLSRKGKTAPDYMANRYTGAILAASAMMFVRILVLMLIFNANLFAHTWYYFLIMAAVTMSIGLYVYHSKKPAPELAKDESEMQGNKNPLEFKVALIFALLFVLFSLLAHYTTEYFGDGGLKVLSFFVGVTDITPFITTLFQGGSALALSVVTWTTLCAAFSNNIVKLLYATTLGNSNCRKLLTIGFSIAAAVNIVLLLIV